MSLQKYRAIDIAIFTLLGLIFDILLIVVSIKVLYIWLYISFSIPILMLLYTRWRKCAIISNVVFMVVHFLVICIVFGFHSENIIKALFNGISLGAIMLSVLFVKHIKKNALNFKVITIWYLSLYVVVFGVEFLLNYLFTGYENLIGYIVFVSLNLVIGYALVCLMYKTKNLMKYQITYLLELQKEKELLNG
ncbi:MAG: hypothetical protein LBV51_02805 [Acholeplasmatales bacterium]|jgi:hypothetical protein|nr:hypothetical protein [Acholeplasmatales bacterium]